MTRHFRFLPLRVLLAAALLMIILSLFPHFLPYERLGGFYGIEGNPVFSSGSPAQEVTLLTKPIWGEKSVCFYVDGKRIARATPAVDGHYTLTLPEALFSQPATHSLSIGYTFSPITTLFTNEILFVVQ